MTMKNNARRLALGLALSLLAWPAIGQDSATSGSVSIGAQGGSGLDDSSKLQQYEVVPEGVFLAGAKLSWKGASDYFLDLKGTHLGLDDQAASLLFGKKGSFKLKVSWDQNPNWMSNTARTPYTETSPGVFRVPDGMRQALQNVFVPWIPGTSSNPVGTGSAPANPTVPGFFAVDPWVSNSQPIDLRYVRKTGKAGLSFPIGKDLTLNLTYSRETREGNKNTTFYGGPDYEVATPIDFKTDDFRAEADYAKGRLFLNGSVNFSKFGNDVPYAVIDNPERLEMTSPITGRNIINDAATFRLWLPPDNKAYTVDFAGGFTLPKKHKVTANVSTGQMKMETDLLNLSSNPNLATSATTPNAAFSIVPPYGSVSIDYSTFLGALKLTGDPSSKFGYSLSFRKFQLKDENEDYSFGSTVRGDVGASVPAEPYVREHHGYDRQSLRAEVHALPASGLRLGVGFAEEKSDYDVREFADVTDKVLTASVDYNRRKLSFHGGFTNLKREPGSENEHAIQPTWQGATQTDITERHRNMFNVLLTVMPKDTFSITFSGMRQTNEFAESTTGLLDQNFSQFGVDVSYVPSDKLSLTAGYVYEKYFFDMAAAYFPRVGSCPTCGPVPPNFDPKTDPNYWSNATTDKIDTFRAALAVTLKPEKWHASLDLDYAKPRSDSAYTFIAGGAGEANGVWPATAVVGFPTSQVSVPTSFSGFPQVSKNFLIAKVRLSYRIEKNLSASVMYWKQKFDNVDWQTENTLPYMGRTDPGSTRWFFLGARVPSYDANIFRASLTYKF